MRSPRGLGRVAEAAIAGAVSGLCVRGRWRPLRRHPLRPGRPLRRRGGDPHPTVLERKDHGPRPGNHRRRRHRGRRHCRCDHVEELAPASASDDDRERGCRGVLSHRIQLGRSRVETRLGDLRWVALPRVAADGLRPSRIPRARRLAAIHSFAPGFERSYVLMTTGYYVPDVTPDPRADPKEVARIMATPGAAARMSLELLNVTVARELLR